MGNDRFATKEELREVLTGTKVSELRLACDDPTKGIACGGPVLNFFGRRIWTHPGEGHSLFLGATGTGKSRRGIIPLLHMLLYAGESAIVVDPKMELYRTTAWLAKKLGYELHLINFGNIFQSERFDILAEVVDLYTTRDPAKQQTALDMVDELGQSLFVESSNDPFWANSARSVFKAAVIALLEHADPKEVNLASVYLFLTAGDEQYFSKTYLQTFLEHLPADSAVARQLKSYCTTANDTRAGIRSSFLEGLSLFSRSDAMVEFFGADDLQISKLMGDKKSLTFISIPDRTSIYDKVCGMLVGQLMSHYIRIADEVYHGALPIRHNFIVDEYGNIAQALCNMPHLLTAGRSRGVRVHYVLQSLSQLTAAHSSADAKTILDNTDIIVAFRTNDWETMEALSKLTGERTIDYGKYQNKEPLMSPAQFQELDTGQAFVTLKGKHRFVAFLPDYTELFDCSEWKEPPYPTRTPGEKPRLFDIKRCIAEVKKKAREAAEEASVEKEPGSVYNFRAGLKKQEEAKRQNHGQKRDKKTDQPECNYSVFVAGLVDGILPEVAKALSAACKISKKEATAKLEAVPFSLPFKTEKKAKAVEKALFDAGAIAVIRTNE